MRKSMQLCLLLVVLTLLVGALAIPAHGNSENQLIEYKSVFYTQGETLLFSYHNNTSFILRDSADGIIWNGTLEEGESKQLTLAEGIYSAFASKPFTMIVGTKQAQTVVGFYAVEPSGKGTSTKLYTYIPPRDPLYSESKFIIFSYTNGTAVNVTDTRSRTVLWRGTLNEGQHFSQDLTNAAWQNKTVCVDSTFPVSVLCYLDQGFAVPSSTGLFTGNLFYTFADNITNGNNDLNIIGYQGSTSVTISNSVSKSLIWNGTISAGEVHSEVFNKPTYLTIESNQSVAVTVDPYPTWPIMYQAALYAGDADGKLIGEQFFTTARGGGYLKIIAYQDDTQVAVVDQTTHTLIWSGTLNEMTMRSISTSHTVYSITSDKPVSVLEGYGEWSATYAPLYFMTDSDPPTLDAISRTPENPTPTQQVQISAVVTDSFSGVQTVILSYSSDGATWTNLAMTPSGGNIYEATIPAMPPQTTVAYKIIAYDNVNNGATSNVFSYVVAAYPTGSISINGGAVYATSPAVTLSLTYSDTSASVSRVRCSNDGTWDNELWETPSPSKAWVLPAGDGNKVVYYQIENSLGMVSPTYSDTVILDTTPPTGSVSIAGGATYTTSATVSLTLTSSDATSGVSQMRLSLDGVFDTEQWENNAVSKSLTIPAGDGTKTVYAQFKDNVGLMSVIFSDTIILDTNAPTGSVTINNGAQYTSSPAVTLNLAYLDGADGSGVAKVRYSSDGIWDSEAWEDLSASRAWNLTAGEGVKTVYCQIRDNAGLVSATYSDTIVLVTSMPSIPNPDDGVSGWSTDNTPTFVWSVSNDTGSIAGCYWRIDAGPETWTTLTSETLPAQSDGVHTFEVRARDNAGNLGGYGSHQYQIDTTPPLGMIVINQGSQYTSSTSVTLTLTYSDTTSGVDKVRYSNDGVWDKEQWEFPSATKSWTLSSGDGTKTVYYQVRDNAGLVASTSKDIILNTGAPTGLILINAGATYTSTTSVNLTLTYSFDANQVRYSNDGIWDTEPWDRPSSSKSWSLQQADGTKTVYYQVMNMAGIASTYSDTIILDSSPPQGSIQINNGAAYTNTVAVNLNLYATDVGSGVSQMRFSNDAATWTTWEPYTSLKLWSLQIGDGVKTVTIQFMDNAGSISSFSDSIILDTSLPTANAGQSQTVNTGTNVLFNAGASADANGLVSYHWDFGDGSTGTGTTTSHTYPNAGNYTAKVTVQDPAGNIASSTVTINAQGPSGNQSSSSSSSSASQEPTTEPNSSPTQTPNPEPETTPTPEPTQTNEQQPTSEQPLFIYMMVVAIAFAVTGAGIILFKRRK